MRPVKGEILTLRPGANPTVGLRRVVRSPAVYLVPRADGRITVGATVAEQSDLVATAGGVHALLDEAFRICPSLREWSLDRVDVGLRPVSADGWPIIGPDPRHPGLTWATGGGRHGIVLLPVVIDAISTGRVPAPFRSDRFAGAGT